MIFLILLLTTVSLLAADTIPLDLRYKGDMIIHNGKYPARQGIGPDGTVLSANSSKSNGVEWISSSGVSNIYNDSKGWVGISNTTPQATLDVAGKIRASAGYSAVARFTNLTGNITLTAGTDAQYQFLNPNGDNRYITLSGANAGDCFVIKNTAINNSPYYLVINNIDLLYSRYSKQYIYDGTNWSAIGGFVTNEIGVTYGQGGDLYKGGEKLGWYKQQIIANPTTFTFPVTNATYRIEIFGYANGNAQIEEIYALICYGASDIGVLGEYVRATGYNGVTQIPFIEAYTVTINTEVERVGYWKFKYTSQDPNDTLSAIYIISRIR